MGSRILIHNLGYPRMGALRQLKKSLEAHWRGSETEENLHKTASDLRRAHWLQQKEAGIDWIPSNDFSLYDHVLDTAAMVGAVPERFGWSGGNVDLETYFALARGSDEVAPLEMTKLFDTNYHYLVPELVAGQGFTLATTKAINEYLEAKSLGFQTRPVLLGPVTFLLLAKTGSDR